MERLREKRMFPHGYTHYLMSSSVQVDDANAGNVQAYAAIWFDAATHAIDGALSPEQRTTTFASAPAVWCAIGALGHDALTEIVGDRFEKSASRVAVEHALQSVAKAKLGAVNWNRDDHWLQVGAKKSMSGAITLGGPKESGSLVYKALKEGVLRQNSLFAS